jgi:hypothetical protein
MGLMPQWRRILPSTRFAARALSSRWFGGKAASKIAIKQLDLSEALHYRGGRFPRVTVDYR